MANVLVLNSMKSPDNQQARAALQVHLDAACPEASKAAAAMITAMRLSLQDGGELSSGPLGGAIEAPISRFPRVFLRHRTCTLHPVETLLGNTSPYTQMAPQRRTESGGLTTSPRTRFQVFTTLLLRFLASPMDHGYKAQADRTQQCSARNGRGKSARIGGRAYPLVGIVRLWKRA